MRSDKIEGLFIIKSHDVMKTKLPRGFIHIIIDINLFDCNMSTYISPTNSERKTNLIHF